MHRIFIIFIFLLLPLSAQARWATFEDADLETKFANINIDVDADGTAHEISERQIVILKEKGRSWAAGYTMHYTEKQETIEILEAKTIFGGKEYKLTPEMIEDKPLASSQHGFDQKRQVLLSFPHAEVGAEIYLKYKLTSKPVLNNYYANVFMYAFEGYLRNAKTTLRSKIPLHLQVNDPQNVFEITNDKADGLHNLTIVLKKPLFQKTMFEPDNALINNKHYAWVSVSSLVNWEQLAKRMSPRYEEVINQPLPQIFTEILQAAQKQKSEIDQIDTVTSLLNTRVKYMGDWRSVEGQFFPRNLAVVAASKVADCKDFSASTAAILQKLGFKVQAVAVMRGVNNYSLDGILPFIYNFNHIFLKVTGKSGKVYWVDPTNVVSMARGIFADVAGKAVLILDSKNPSYSKSASINPEQSRFSVVDNLSIDKDYVLHEGSIDLQGEEAQRFFELGLYTSEQAFRDIIFKWLAGEELEANDKISLTYHKLGGKVVHDVKMQFKYGQRNGILQSNISPAIRIQAPWVRAMVDYSPKQIGDLLIGEPSTLSKRTIINGIKIKDIKKLNIDLSTEWIDVKRSCYYEGDNTIIADLVVIKKNLIAREALEDSAYKNLRQTLIQNFANVVIVLEVG